MVFAGGEEPTGGDAEDAGVVAGHGNEPLGEGGDGREWGARDTAPKVRTGHAEYLPQPMATIAL
ncbi:hypothetical protein GCM10009779_70450 [Polymorphospora rubra]